MSMTEFYIMTLFPDMVTEGLNTSILKRAIDAGVISVKAVDMRDYTLDKHRKVDDYPYGGGAGMLIQAQPVFDTYKSIVADDTKKCRVLYMTPQGRRFDQQFAEELSKEEKIIFLCGHYEGIDERVIEEIVTDEVSLGDFVLTGGELPAMVMTDCISRLIPGVLGSEKSAEDESFSDGLLEYPQYTRPEEWMGKKVPEVLLSGNHKEIKKWRTKEALLRTEAKRPDLYEKTMEELNRYKAENPKKFRKKKSLEEELIKMREDKAGLK